MKRPTKSDGSPIPLSPRVARYVEELEKTIAQLEAERDKALSGKSDVVLIDYDGTKAVERGIPSKTVYFWLSREPEARIEVRLVTDDPDGPCLRLCSYVRRLIITPSASNSIYVTEERHAPTKTKR